MRVVLGNVSKEHTNTCIRLFKDDFYDEIDHSPHVRMYGMKNW